MIEIIIWYRLLTVRKMKPDRSVPYSLLMVVLAHLGVAVVVMQRPPQPALTVLEPPILQGLIITSKAVTPAPATLPPPPVQKPQPPTRVAPKQERAVERETASEEAASEDATPPQVAPSHPSTSFHGDTPKPVIAPVMPPNADAAQLDNPPPTYPMQSRRLREEGLVVLEVLVKADGSLGDMRLKSSSGYTRLDDAAQRAVKRWRFLPAKRGGEAVDFWYELPIEFSLNH